MADVAGDVDNTVPSIAEEITARFLNVINLFNQKTATHIFNYLNKGAPAGSQAKAGSPSQRRFSQQLRIR